MGTAEHSKVTILKLFRILTKKQDYSDNTAMAVFYYNNLCYYLWKQFDKPKIPNFGESLLLDEYPDNIMPYCFLFRYMKSCISRIQRMVRSYDTLLKELFKKRKDDKLVPQSNETLKAELLSDCLDKLFIELDGNNPELHISKENIPTYLNFRETVNTSSNQVSAKLAQLLEYCLQVYF
jgi:hypothetical protein